MSPVADPGGAVIRPLRAGDVFSPEFGWYRGAVLRPDSDGLFLCPEHAPDDTMCITSKTKQDKTERNKTANERNSSEDPCRGS
ncbi:MAG TPA: hypothetical protein DEW22_06260 [Clostridiales bacterium]|nr:hypothetical protein [Clostridiales bacterium]